MLRIEFFNTGEFSDNLLFSFLFYPFGRLKTTRKSPLLFPSCQNRYMLTLYIKVDYYFLVHLPCGGNFSIYRISAH